MPRTVVVIPTYNERENVAKLVPAVRAAADCDVLVVDDDSPDGTAAAVIHTDNARLLGAFNECIPLWIAEQTGSTSGMLVLYSLADQEIVEISKSFRVP